MIAGRLSAAITCSALGTARSINVGSTSAAVPTSQKHAPHTKSALRFEIAGRLVNDGSTSRSKIIRVTSLQHHTQSDTVLRLIFPPCAALGGGIPCRAIPPNKNNKTAAT